MLYHLPTTTHAVTLLQKPCAVHVNPVEDSGSSLSAGSGWQQGRKHSARTRQSGRKIQESGSIASSSCTKPCDDGSTNDSRSNSTQSHTHSEAGGRLRAKVVHSGGGCHEAEGHRLARTTSPSARSNGCSSQSGADSKAFKAPRAAAAESLSMGSKRHVGIAKLWLWFWASVATAMWLVPRCMKELRQKRGSTPPDIFR